MSDSENYDIECDTDFLETTNRLSASVIISTHRDNVHYCKESTWCNIVSWGFLDVASTLWSTAFISLVGNRLLLVSGQLEHGWSYGQSYSRATLIGSLFQIVTAIMMPPIGAVADALGSRKPFAILLLLIAAVISLLPSLTSNFWLLAVIIFAGNAVTQWMNCVFDSMLPFIADKGKVALASSLTLAYANIGFGIAAGETLLLDSWYGTPVSRVSADEPVIEFGYFGEPFSYVLLVATFLVISLPFWFAKETVFVPEKVRIGVIISGAFEQLVETLKNMIRHHKEIFKFVIGYFFFADATGLLIVFIIPIMRDGCGLSESAAMNIFIASAVCAVILTTPLGWVGKKKGPRAIFTTTALLWTVALVAIMANIWIFDDEWGFNAGSIVLALIPIFAGPALSGAWIGQRLFMVELCSPFPQHFAKFLAISKFAGKSSSSLGGLIFGQVISISQSLGSDISSSYGFALLFVFFLIFFGLWIILKVRTPSEKIVPMGATVIEEVEYIDEEEEFMFEDKEEDFPILETGTINHVDDFSTPSKLLAPNTTDHCRISPLPEDIDV
ncbi:hypothetical protein PCE1_003108 [Barthelona sp. PCE]